MRITELRKMLAVLKEARQYATLEKASFDCFDMDFIFALMPSPEKDDSPATEFRKVKADEFIKERTRLHRQSWILPGIDAVIEWMQLQIGDETVK